MSSMGPDPPLFRLDPVSYENLRQQVPTRDGARMGWPTGPSFHLPEASWTSWGMGPPRDRIGGLHFLAAVAKSIILTQVTKGP
jgi:hypothetical protein